MPSYFPKMADPLLLRDATGRPLNAKLEVTSDGFSFHSRSGTDRNRDYRQGLELLMERLDSAGIRYEVYLDSRPSQPTPLVERRLSFDRSAPVSTRFDELVRAMNAGSSSHGAWRRLLITTPGTAMQAARAAVEGSIDASTAMRLPASELRKVTTQHIQRAVARLLRGDDAPNFGPSRDYDALTDDGVPLAPKKVFGLALEEALKIEAFPKHFSAGWGQVCFELLEAAGLWIVPKGEGVRRPAAAVQPGDQLENLPQSDEERGWAEGNPRIVTHLKRERQAGLAKAKRADFIAKHGRLFCEDCALDPVEKYGPEAGDACIEVHHSRVHIADMGVDHVTTLNDLRCLCASCHRVLHRKLSLGLSGLGHT